MLMGSVVTRFSAVLDSAISVEVAGVASDVDDGVSLVVGSSVELVLTVGIGVVEVDELVLAGSELITLLGASKGSVLRIVLGASVRIGLLSVLKNVAAGSVVVLIVGVMNGFKESG